MSSELGPIRLTELPTQPQMELHAAELARRMRSGLVDFGIDPTMPEAWRLFALRVLARKAPRPAIEAALLSEDRLAARLTKMALNLPDPWMAAAFSMAEAYLPALRVSTPWDIETARQGRQRDPNSRWREAMRAALANERRPLPRGAATTAARGVIASQPRRGGEPAPTARHLARLATEDDDAERGMRRLAKLFGQWGPVKRAIVERAVELLVLAHD